jgi:hypothetical protein
MMSWKVTKAGKAAVAEKPGPTVNAAVSRRRAPVTEPRRKIEGGTVPASPPSSRQNGLSEEKVPLVGFPFSLSVSSEAHLFRVVGAEFIAEELTARCAPRL